MTFIRISTLICVICASAGCETIKGVGRDITRGAEAIDRSL